MKLASYFLALFCSAAAFAGPVTLLTDSRYRYSDGFAKYQSTNSTLNGQQSIGWNMTAKTAFGGMDGYDLNEIPIGNYNSGYGTYLGGMVGMLSKFESGEIGASGFTSNFLGVATDGPRAAAGDTGYARLAMKSHYEITFSVNEAVYFDMSGVLLGGSSLSFFSDNGFSLLGADIFSTSGMLNAGTYTIMADASTTLEQSSNGATKDNKQFSFDLNYRAVPDGGTSALLVGLGFVGVMALARRRK